MKPELLQFLQMSSRIPINKVTKPINGRLLIKEGNEWNELDNGPFALMQSKKTSLIKGGTKKENLRITY